MGSSLVTPRNPKPALRNSASRRFGALASIHARTLARKAASSGVSSKFICRPPSGRRRRVLAAQALDKEVLPGRKRPQRQGQEVRAAIIEVAVERPGEAHPAVDLDVVPGAVLEGLGRRDPGGGGRHRKLG